MYLAMEASANGEPLDINMDADGLWPGFRPGSINPRDVTEADRIEDRRGGRGMRIVLKTPALQGSRSVRGPASWVLERMLL